jgi:hypothetical protein
VKAPSVAQIGSFYSGDSGAFYGFVTIFINSSKKVHHFDVILSSGSSSCPSGDNMMRVQSIIASILACAPFALHAQVQAPETPAQLVREVVYNELHDHQRHGYWRYWIEKQAQQQIKIEEQVETADGPVTRLISSSGRPLNATDQQQEEQRLEHLLRSPQEQARHRQDYADDEKRIGRILALLPEAFLFEEAGIEKECFHLRFRPNPDYPPHSIEARIFHAMRGELWIDARTKRMERLDGQLDQNVDFGYGILGRLYKGGWFRLERRQVSSTDWKTERLEIHMNGRALFLKTISRETSEVRGGFTPVPAGMSLAQGMQMLDPTQTAAMVKPASFAAVH